jgi:hypothetical protein
MKKYLIGFLTAAVLFIPGTVIAGRVIETPKANPIYDDNQEADVSVFDDGDNKCYIYHETNQLQKAGISCVKK